MWHLQAPSSYTCLYWPSSFAKLFGYCVICAPFGVPPFDPQFDWVKSSGSWPGSLAACGSRAPSPQNVALTWLHPWLFVLYVATLCSVYTTYPLWLCPWVVGSLAGGTSPEACAATWIYSVWTHRFCLVCRLLSGCWPSVCFNSSCSWQSWKTCTASRLWALVCCTRSSFRGIFGSSLWSCMEF